MISDIAPRSPAGPNSSAALTTVAIRPSMSPPAAIQRAEFRPIEFINCSLLAPVVWLASRQLIQEHELVAVDVAPCL